MAGHENRDGSPEEDPRHGLVLTAVGPDRPGLVKGLAAQIRKWGGNLEDTRMSKLGGEFAVLMLVTGSPESLARIKAARKEMELETGLSCSLRSTIAALSSEPSETHRFVATGMDRPGIVEAVTRVLAERNVNLTSLESRVDNAPLTGTLMFILEAEVTLPTGIHIDDLENELADACEREDLEFTLMRA
jgi:glycine cleavage system transcriptional repressor